IYNGINIPKSIDKAKSKKLLLQKFSFLEDKTLLLFVGNGYARKGLKQALLMLSNVRSKSWHFLILGKEKKLPLYQKFTKALNLQNHVLFLESMQETKLFYESSDIFLFPTIYEPCSNATLEAASYQNAIITTKQNGAGELFDKALILDNPNTIAKGAKLLNQLLEDPNFLKQTQQECAKAISDLTLEKNLQKTLKVLEQL
ncbi:MAG: glycosyltransferase family 4 protein, partial [Helicobacter sp.]|nr:glycosyltransferase family 4 protein [Helicobacter sp.]